MTSIVTSGGSTAIWQQTMRGLQAVVVASAAASVSLAFAALAFFLLIILVAETNISPTGFGEDFPVVFSSVLPIALIAAVFDCVAVLRADAQRSNDIFAGGFVTLLLVLGAIALWGSFWFSEDKYPSGGGDLLVVLGIITPGIAVVVGNWAFVRFFFWISGLTRL